MSIIHLIGISKSTRSVLDAKDVVPVGKHVHIGIRSGTSLHANRGSGGVDPRKVTCSRRLVLFRLQRKTVGVKAGHGATRVGLERLDGVEILTGLALETLGTVQLKVEAIQRSIGGFSDVFSCEYSNDA